MTTYHRSSIYVEANNLIIIGCMYHLQKSDELKCLISILNCSNPEFNLHSPDLLSSFLLEIVYIKKTVMDFFTQCTWCDIDWFTNIDLRNRLGQYHTMFTGFKVHSCILCFDILVRMKLQLFFSNTKITIVIET